MKAADWTYFRKQLLDWYEPDRRPMPWKGLRNPYLIWLSEIILQQTRVEQGWPYFERFRDAYPTVANLAAASEDEVLRLWQGLGYYSRGRNLLKAAKMVMDEFDGIFPATHADILRLPGVGPYTAAAIASFAYDLPTPVLDGNVYRILARYTDEELPIDSTPGKKKFAAYAAQAMGNAPSAVFNQAIMDFGALVCKPKGISCTKCPVSSRCKARKADTIPLRPVKKPKRARRERHFHFLLIRRDDEVLVERRGEGDIWAGLYQPPLVEFSMSSINGLPQVDSLPVARHSVSSKKNSIGIDHPKDAATSEWPEQLSWLVELPIFWARRYPPKAQILTHQKIVGHFHEIAIESDFSPPEKYIWANQQKIEKLALPKLIDDFFKEKALSLDLF
ncbi:MAG: A/G-specific adenine glycosylase [Bacteroidota bacterium]